MFICRKISKRESISLKCRRPLVVSLLNVCYSYPDDAFKRVFGSYPENVRYFADRVRVKEENMIDIVHIL